MLQFHIFSDPIKMWKMIQFFKMVAVEFKNVDNKVFSTVLGLTGL